MNGARTNLTLGDVEAKAKNYRAARDLLADRVRQLQEQLEVARRHAEPLIRSALMTAKAAESELSAAIADNLALFKKPRTHVFHGVRVGIEKGKGAVVIADKARTVELIRKHLDDELFDVLVKTKHTPIKKAIQQLDAKDLKRIGVEVGDAGDFVVIRPVDTELEKMLEVLLKTASEPVEDDA
jgi:hypothetical protein